jgi:hypothetical protein
MNKASEPKQAKLATVKVGNYVQYTLRALRKCETVGELDEKSKLRGFVMERDGTLARLLWTDGMLSLDWIEVDDLRRCPRDTTERAVDLDARPSER